MNRTRWYAVRTRSRTEKVVGEHLQRQDIETFLPLVSKVSRWKNRHKRIEWSLFPGLCFARFTLSEKPHVLQLPHVVEIMGSAVNQAEAIPDEEIVALQRVMQAGRVRDAHPVLEEGIWVEIIRGPLIGLRAMLVRHGSRSRIIIPINLIRQGAVVDIEADEIAPVEPPTAPGHGQQCDTHTRYP